MPLTLSSSQTICTALIRRMKDKLETKNPYLLIYISEAIYRLEFWNLQFGVFRNDTKNLSKNIVYALQADSTHMLDSIRPLESVLRPLEKEWTTIPRDVETQCKFVCDALFLIAEDMYVLREVVALSCISRSDSSYPPSRQPSNLYSFRTKHQTVNLEIIRKHVINMRAVQGRTYALQEDSKKSLSSTQIMEKSEMKPNKSLVHVLIPVLNIVGPGTTDRDIATLILRWTTLDEFNGFTRVR